jgi:hypothetical protein
MKILGERDNFYKNGILESTRDELTHKAKLIWEDKDPELLLRVAYNNDPSTDSGSWKPREEYAFNAIQRNPDRDEVGNLSFWCKENKHTKLLKMGIMAYKSLQDVRLNDGELSEYDINYLKKGVGFGTKHNILKAGANVPNVVIGPLTEEEKNYTRYTLQEEFKLSSASYILKFLRNQIFRIDTLMGTSWISQLEKQASIEASNTDVVESVPSTIQEKPKTGVVTRMSPRSAVLPKTEVCGYCKKQIPAGSQICPECKNTLIEPCNKCGVPFSVFSDTCPACGEQYKID